MTPFLLDMHCHTAERSYDGEVPLAEIVAALHAKGFHGLVVTDHNRTWPAEDLAEVRGQAGVPETFVLLAGQEVRSALEGITLGDLLVYGPLEEFPDGTPPDELIAKAREAGGFVTAAHVGVPRIGFGPHLADFPAVIGAEVWNGRYGARIAELSEEIVAPLSVARLGGSDTHRPGDIGGGGTLFAELPASIADLGRLVRSGECEPWRPKTTSRLWRWLTGD